jgi:hypothetical protein
MVQCLFHSAFFPLTHGRDCSFDLRGQFFWCYITQCQLLKAGIYPLNSISGNYGIEDKSWGM